MDWMYINPEKVMTNLSEIAVASIRKILLSDSDEKLSAISGVINFIDEVGKSMVTSGDE